MTLKKDDILRYWVDTAEQDFKTLQHLFDSEDYHWGLFIGHLVLEKLFKALYVLKNNSPAPRLHDLTLLAQKCGLEPNENLMNKLDLITKFNLNVRYPDYLHEVYRICTREFSLRMLADIKEIREWLLQHIKKS